MAKERDEGIQVRKSVQGLTKSQLVEFFRRRESQRRMKDDATAVLLPDYDDPNSDLVSEVHPLGALSKMHMKFMIRAFNPERQENLIEAWDRVEDRVMMALKRQRTWELMMMKNAVSATEEQEKLGK